EVAVVPKWMLASGRLQAPASLARFRAAGAVMVGFSLLVMFTICGAVVLSFPTRRSSDLTVVLPTGKELGASLTAVATAQLSAVVVVRKEVLTPAPQQAPAPSATVRAAGAVMVGFSLSVMVTICGAVALLP